MKLLLLIACSLCPLAVAATRIETVRNEKVIAYEETLRPGESEAASERLPGITVFLSDGVIRHTPEIGPAITTAVKRGQALFRSAGDGRIAPVGRTEIRFVRSAAPACSAGWTRRGFEHQDRRLPLAPRPDA